jgi:hypothetical protein
MCVWYDFVVSYIALYTLLSLLHQSYIHYYFDPIFFVAHVSKERCWLLGPRFMCGSIDFWTEGHHKESYGALVVDMLAEQYDMKNGQSLFMSRETKEKLMNEKLMEDSPLVTGKPILDHLEYVLNFEHFTKSKTIANVTDWMFESTAEGKVQKDDFGHLAADGGSNAVGAVQEYKVVGQE